MSALIKNFFKSPISLAPENHYENGEIWHASEEKSAFGDKICDGELQICCISNEYVTVWKVSVNILSFGIRMIFFSIFFWKTNSVTSE